MEQGQEKSSKKTKKIITSVSEKAQHLKTKVKEINPYIESFNEALYWITAIMVGTFVWFIGSFDKFIVDGVMPYKLLFILSSLALGLAVILIGLSFSMLWYLRISLTKFDAETIGKEEELKLEEYRQALGNLGNAMKDLKKVKPPVMGAFICYGFGILLVTIYIIIFILFNL